MVGWAFRKSQRDRSVYTRVSGSLQKDWERQGHIALAFPSLSAGFPRSLRVYACIGKPAERLGKARAMWPCSATSLSQAVPKMRSALRETLLLKHSRGCTSGGLTLSSSALRANSPLHASPKTGLSWPMQKRVLRRSSVFKEN